MASARDYNGAAATGDAARWEQLRQLGLIPAAPPSVDERASAAAWVAGWHVYGSPMMQ